MDNRWGIKDLVVIIDNYDKDSSELNSTENDKNWYQLLGREQICAQKKHGETHKSKREGTRTTKGTEQLPYNGQLR